MTEFLANLDSKSFENCQLSSKSSAISSQTQKIVSGLSNSGKNSASLKPIKHSFPGRQLSDDRTSLAEESTSLISLPSSSSSSRPSVSLELHDSKVKSSKRIKANDIPTEYVTIVSSPSTCSATNTTTFSPLSTPSTSSVNEIKQVPLPTVRGLRRKDSFTIGPLKPSEEQVYQNQEQLSKTTPAFETKFQRPSTTVSSTPSETSSSFFISFPSSIDKEVKEGNPSLNHPSPSDDRQPKTNKNPQDFQGDLIDEQDIDSQASVRCKIPRFLRSSTQGNKIVGKKSTDSSSLTRPSSESCPSGKALIRHETFSKGKRPLIQEMESESSSSDSSPDEQAASSGHQRPQLIDFGDDVPSTSRKTRSDVFNEPEGAEGENFYHELDFDDLDGMDASGLLLLDQTEYLSPPPSYLDVIENATDYPDSPTASASGNDFNRPQRKGTL